MESDGEQAMNRRQLLRAAGGAFGLLLTARLPAFADTPWYNEETLKETSKQIDSFEAAGLPITHMFFFNPKGLNQAASDRLRMHRVMKKEEWDALTPDQRKERLKELKKLNRNIFACLPDGNLYSITNEKFITFLYKITEWPEWFLDEDEEDDFYNMRNARLYGTLMYPRIELPGPHGRDQGNQGGNNQK
jgi:hypothetical protein